MKKGKKLGDMLVSAGLVTRLDIDHALQAQHIFGGRLGTNLVEMGAIDDETLAGFLAEQFGVPRARLEELENIPEDVLALIPARAAQRLSILPLAKTSSGLALAMMDPTDTRVIRRLEENTRILIEPRIATELEIRYFLERYYGVQRETRHIVLMNQVLEQRKAETNPVQDLNRLQSFLDRHGSRSDAITFFFSGIGSVDAVPTKNSDVDLTQQELTPELTFLLLQVDGISSVDDLFNLSPFPRMVTLRALLYLSRVGLVTFPPPEPAEETPK